MENWRPSLARLCYESKPDENPCPVSLRQAQVTLIIGKDGSIATLLGYLSTWLPLLKNDIDSAQKQIRYAVYGSAERKDGRGC